MFSAHTCLYVAREVVRIYQPKGKLLSAEFKRHRQWNNQFLELAIVLELKREISLTIFIC